MCIFKTEWLHKLQVRYPWFCGYAGAPLAFVAGRAYGDGSLTLVSKHAPLLAQDHSLASSQQAALVAGLLFNSHFVRRALEVIYINDYTGTWERDSRFELLYYVLWGLLAGSASGKLPLQVHGVAAPHIRLLGMCLCIIGQCGNSWCHLELRRLRKQRRQSSHFSQARG